MNELNRIVIISSVSEERCMKVAELDAKWSRSITVYVYKYAIISYPLLNPSIAEDNRINHEDENMLLFQTKWS